MKLLDSIYDYSSNNIYLFFEDNKKGLIKMKELYELDDSDESFDIHLGYEEPRISTFSFLGKEYPCVSLWYDYEYDMGSDANIEFKEFIQLNKSL